MRIGRLAAGVVEVVVSEDVGHVEGFPDGDVARLHGEHVVDSEPEVVFWALRHSRLVCPVVGCIHASQIRSTLQWCRKNTGSFGDDDSPMSPRSPPTHLWTWSYRFTSRLCRKTGRFVVVPGTGQWGDHGSYALDEVDAVTLSPTLKDLAVGGARHLLNKWRTVWLRIESMVTRSRFSSSALSSPRARKHSVAGPGRQQIVDLRPHPVVATYPASRFEVKPIDGWGRLRRRRGFVDNAAERLGHRHDPSFSVVRTRTVIDGSFSHK